MLRDALSVRLQLTLAFAACMAVLLGVGGLAIRTHVQQSLDTSIDSGLRAQADDLGALLSHTPIAKVRLPTGRLAGEDARFAQVYDAKGALLISSERFQGQPLLTARDARRVAAGRTVRRNGSDSGEGGGSYRLLATPIGVHGHPLVGVVGASLDARRAALGALDVGLLAGGPAALLVASLIGMLVASLALRSVERVRAQAERIDEQRLRERLPVPRARDELQRLTMTLNRMLDRLEAAVQRERHFVADASHELRTPIALLKAELEVALAEGLDTGDDERAAATVQRLARAIESAGQEADHLSQLADALLLLSQGDAGSLPLQLADLDVATSAHSVAARFERRAAQLDRSVDVRVAPSLALHADRLRFEQALAGLVDNALRHGAGTVTVCAALDDGAIVVDVVDEGPGIPAGEVAQAFERFASGGTGPGVGLGLSIVRTIAVAHGGRAEAVEQEDGRTFVRLWIPRARPRNGVTASNSVST